MEYLDLKANELATLPPNFSSLKKLKHLSIAYNTTLDMNAAAVQLKLMTNLQTLDISFNQLTPQLYQGLRQALPGTKIIAKGFNNLVWDPDRR